MQFQKYLENSIPEKLRTDIEQNKQHYIQALGVKTE